MSLSNFRRLVLALLLLTLPVRNSIAQTLTSATVVGTVTDSSGAIVPGVTVTIKQPETYSSSKTTTDSVGRYRFPFLKPGEYEVTAEGAGLATATSRFQLQVGREQAVNLILAVKAVQQTVEVNTGIGLLQTENGNSVTSYSQQYIENTPVNGGDITNIAFSTPGIRINVGGGNANFNVNGLPFNSVLFTMNGADIVEPYNNNNKSGSSNNTLGANDIAEASVITNAYSAQYGREAGAQVNYISKSGTNHFHGNLVENYNGSFLNANDFFNNASGTPRARAVANQYAASIGGPIVRDKVAFFLNTEGLDYALPSAGVVSLPSAALQTYVLAHVPTSALSYYQAIFALYNTSPGIGRAVPVVNGASGSFVDTTGNQGCGKNGFSGTYLSGTSGPQFGGASGVSCAVAFGTTASSVNTEYTIVGRVDWNINTNQKLYFRISRDAGVQASSTNPVNALFSGRSPQPWVIPQLNYTFAITPRLVNNLILNGNYYSVVGGADTQAQLKLIPLAIGISDGGASGGGFPTLAPSLNTGRIGQQLGIIDDLSWAHGRHTIQVGVNNRENRISSSANISGSLPSYSFGSLADYAKGTVTDSKNFNSFSQAFPLQPYVHIRVDSLGFYGQDEWKVLRNLNLTFGARFEYQGNPWCKESCYSRANTIFLGNWYQAGANVPYNATLQTGLDKNFKELEGIVIEPRFGFAYSPYGEGKTVIRGGIGLFANTFTASITSNVYGNSPNKFTPKVTTGIVGLSPTAGTSQATAIASNTAFQSGFSNGYTLTQLQAAVGAGVTFSTPGLYVNPNKFHTNKVLEWSLEIEQPITPRDVLTVAYSGNHSYNYALSDAAANGASSKGFGGLPTAAPDPRFAIVTQIYDTGYGNYNGLTVSERHAFVHGFQGSASYTWSKSLALTTIYNPTVYSPALLAVTGKQSDGYGPTNFDTRNNFSADFVYTTPKFSKALLNHSLGGWKFGGKVYLYSGRPFSVTNGGINGATAGLSSTFSGSILADVIQPSALGTHCSRSSVNLAGHTPCLSTSNFATAASQNDWGNIKPNSFRGPGYFSVASQLSKSIPVTEHQHFEIGADAYNLFNHPNFGLPTSDVNSGNFGLITSTQSSPTSIYGTGQGSAVSGRVLVVFGKFIF
jgi:Carboxypeptidase regulatory-like domain/TonB-dependent Receptor Plug Domain